METTESNPKRKHIRVLWHEYDEGFYFITICTKNKSHHFRKISDGIMQLSTIGKIADYGLKMIPTYYPDTNIQQYIIMPNHIHAIIRIGNPMLLPHNFPKSTYNAVQEITKQRRTTALSRAITAYKIYVTRNAHKINPYFNWQTRYYDHIIRDIEEYENIANYIITNPINWSKDCYYIHCK